MKGFIKILLMAISVALSFPAFTEIKEVNVVTEGIGENLAVAINSALSQAVAEVNGVHLQRDTSTTSSKSHYDWESYGVHLQGDTIMTDAELTVQSSFGEAYFESDEYLDVLRSNSGGAVKTYQLLEKTERDDGQWMVKVRSQIVQYEADVTAKRQRLAVMALRSDIDSFSIAGQRLKAVKVKSRIDQYLTSALSQSQKFTVLDRAYLAESDAEKRLLTPDRVSIKEMARLGQQLGTDYMLVGKLVDFEYRRSTRTTRATGREYRVGKAHAEVDYRLINAVTQQILLSDTARIGFNDEGKLGSQQALSKLGQLLAAAISERIHGQVFPVMLVAIENRTLVFGQGGNGVVEGEQYKLFKYGKEIFDPYTEESLGQMESEVGVIEIKRVGNRQTYGEIVSSIEDIVSEFEPRKYILREKVQKPKKVPAPMKKSTASRIDVSEDDW